MGERGSKNILNELISLESSLGDHPLTVPQELAQALIENALTSLKRSLRRKRKREITKRRMGKDWKWFISTDEKPCSFIWCCETLGVEPSYLRKLILPS